MTRTAYFDGPLPRVLAHRGFAGPGAPGNSLASFRRALDAGADILESDVRASADGVAVLVHDADLDGVPVATLTAAALAERQVPSLESALREFPEARFNLDIKAADAAAPAALVIGAADAAGRVLLTSFSRRRRQAAVRVLDAPVATSASSLGTVLALLAASTGSPALTRLVTRGVDALQIPVRAPARVGGMTLLTAPRVAVLRAAGIEVHVWTLQTSETLREALTAGAVGLVTDHTDVAVAVVGEWTARSPR